ncbi:MAG: DUF4145 domain-containing protein [bacterium]
MGNTMSPIWQDAKAIPCRRFKCGFCGMIVASEKGFVRAEQLPTNEITTDEIYICSNCDRPTFFDQRRNQYPGYPFGNYVQHISSKEVKALYQEARYCTSVYAYTCAVLACRKLLMNIAVDKGAPAGKKFVEYVEYLSDQNYVPPDGKGWVDRIRTTGNEATHEIALMKKEDAEDLITFVEMLLKFVYEFPAKVKPSKP